MEQHVMIEEEISIAFVQGCTMEKRALTWMANIKNGPHGLSAQLHAEVGPAPGHGSVLVQRVAGSVQELAKNHWTVTPILVQLMVASPTGPAGAIALRRVEQVPGTDHVTVIVQRHNMVERIVMETQVEKNYATHINVQLMAVGLTGQPGQNVQSPVVVGNTPGHASAITLLLSMVETIVVATAQKLKTAILKRVLQLMVGGVLGQIGLYATISIVESAAMG